MDDVPWKLPQFLRTANKKNQFGLFKINIKIIPASPRKPDIWFGIDTSGQTSQIYRSGVRFGINDFHIFWWS
jgi:hypothetical protein